MTATIDEGRPAIRDVEWDEFGQSRVVVKVLTIEDAERLCDELSRVCAQLRGR